MNSRKIAALFALFDGIASYFCVSFDFSLFCSFYVSHSNKFVWFFHIRSMSIPIVNSHFERFYCANQSFSSSSRHARVNASLCKGAFIKEEPKMESNLNAKIALKLQFRFIIVHFTCELYIHIRHTANTTEKKVWKKIKQMNPHEICI